MCRDTLFISHATPEDNEFSIWLASRLEMLGYKIWIDKQGLLGGERFWTTIQNVIKDDAIKILLVYSKNICNPAGDLKDGIDKELSYAESIAQQENINDFIIPLHINNNVPFNSFIGSNRLNHIPFDSNWAEGLKQLLKKLEKDAVPRTTDIKDSSFSEWYENEYISDCSIKSTKELYYTTWWTIDDMPDRFYMYKFNNRKQAYKVRESNLDLPLSLLSNVISSFDPELPMTVFGDDGEKIEITPEDIYEFSISDVLNGFASNEFPTHKDVENHFKKFISHVVEVLFKRNDLWKYKMSNKRFAYYLPNYKSNSSIQFIFPYTNRKKRKSILGKFKDIGFWHYAVSLQTILVPFVGFSIKSHLIFTKDGFEAIDDHSRQHSYRRSKGKRFFNEEWRDLFLAFIRNLIDNDEDIKIVVSNNGKVLKMDQWPEMFWSDIGYIDPNSDMTLERIENYIFEENEDD